jgi:hypothetical protein
MINTNQKERDRNAAKDYRAKLILELALFREMQDLFRQYSKEFEKTYASTSSLPHPEILKEDTQNLLLNHYNRVSDKFTTRLVDEIGIPANHEFVLKSMRNKIEIHNQLRSVDSASIISDTTHKDSMQAITDTINEFRIKEGFDKTIEPKRIARDAKLKLDRRLRSRTNTISITETQNPAEHTKQEEINSLHNNESEVDGEKIHEQIKQKQWNAVLDNVTREAHAESDGQIVNFDEPYLVGGQNLMYPGDMSLGATIDNTINCRCTSIVIIR